MCSRLLANADEVLKARYVIINLQGVAFILCGKTLHIIDVFAFCIFMLSGPVCMYVHNTRA